MKKVITIALLALGFITTSAFADDSDMEDKKTFGGPTMTKNARNPYAHKKMGRSTSSNAE